MIKKKILFIFKQPYHWNPDIIDKFSNYFEVESINISEFDKESFSEIVSKINNLIKTKNIEITVFDVDYFKFLNLFFIQEIICKKKILITGDDVENHEMNSITASGCDIVLTHDPLSVLKFREKGFESYHVHFDSGKTPDNYDTKKEIDVLYFGILNSDRNEFLDYIKKQNINLKNVGHISDENRLKDEDLFKLIQKSKIVINFSKTRSDFIRSYTSKNLYKFHYMFKGRLALVGLNGAACVSEYSPGQEILFKKDEVPYFFTKEECVDILKKLLNDEKLLNEYTKKFTTKAHNLFEEKKNILPIYNALQKSNSDKVQIFKLPYWYLRISAKQITVRNISIFKPKVLVSNLNNIFKILKKSNILEKILILIEYLLNIIWYTFKGLLNKKK